MNDILGIKINTDRQKDRFFVDGHVDLPYYMMNHAKSQTAATLDHGPFTLEKAAQSGVRLFCTALYCEDKYNGEASYSRFQEILKYTHKTYKRVPVIGKKAELEQIKASENQIGTVLLLENADVLAGKSEHLEAIMEAGIRMVGLTHVGKNRLADGNMVRYSDGFRSRGKEIVQELTQSGIIIDIAHLHEKCFWQLLDITDAAIITSHTGIKNICNTPRNIDLEMAGKICERNGIIGITFNPEMLSLDGKADAEKVFMHLDTIVQCYGPINLGIGSDFCGYDVETEGLEDITGLKRLINILSAHGYDKESIKGIMGGNWLRFYETVF